jgi:hypothetical protein
MPAACSQSELPQTMPAATRSIISTNPITTPDNQNKHRSCYQVEMHFARINAAAVYTFQHMCDFCCTEEHCTYIFIIMKKTKVTKNYERASYIRRDTLLHQRQATQTKMLAAFLTAFLQRSCSILMDSLDKHCWC